MIRLITIWLHDVMVSTMYSLSSAHLPKRLRYSSCISVLQADCPAKKSNR